MAVNALVSVKWLELGRYPFRAWAVALVALVASSTCKWPGFGLSTRTRHRQPATSLRCSSSQLLSSYDFKQTHLNALHHAPAHIRGYA